MWIGGGVGVLRWGINNGMGRKQRRLPALLNGGYRPPTIGYNSLAATLQHNSQSSGAPGGGVGGRRNRIVKVIHLLTEEHVKTLRNARPHRHVIVGLNSTRSVEVL